MAVATAAARPAIDAAAVAAPAASEAATATSSAAAEDEPVICGVAVREHHVATDASAVAAEEHRTSAPRGGAATAATAATAADDEYAELEGFDEDNVLEAKDDAVRLCVTVLRCHASLTRPRMRGAGHAATSVLLGGGARRPHCQDTHV